MGKNGVAWSKEVGEALIKLKEHLRNLPTLARPRPNEPLVIYLSTSREAISAVLVAEREKKKQMPVYFVSRVLQGVELNYSLVEKLILFLVYIVRRLQRYFQAHLVTMLFD